MTTRSFSQLIKVLSPSRLSKEAYMFSIVLYNNKSSDITLDKVLESVSTISGTLRDSSSIYNPHIIIEQSDVPSFNYCYIPSFKRYYSLKNITSIRSNIWDIELEVDVLKTYASGIRSLTGVVSRNEFGFDQTIPDERLVTTNDKTVEVIKFGASGVSFKPDDATNILMLTNNS